MDLVILNVQEVSPEAEWQMKFSVNKCVYTKQILM